MRKSFKEHLQDVAQGKIRKDDPLASYAPTQKAQALADGVSELLKSAGGLRYAESPALAGKLTPAAYGLWG